MLGRNKKNAFRRTNPSTSSANTPPLYSKVAAPKPGTTQPRQQKQTVHADQDEQPLSPNSSKQVINMMHNALDTVTISTMENAASSKNLATSEFLNTQTHQPVTLKVTVQGKNACFRIKSRTGFPMINQRFF